jgi:hypothetical protein
MCFCLSQNKRRLFPYTTLADWFLMTESITYSECVFVALGIYHAKFMRHIVISGPSGSAVFFHINKRHDLKKNAEHKMCFDIL